LQALLAETNTLDEINKRHQETTAEAEKKVLDQVLHQTACVLRAEFDVFEKLTIKSTEGSLNSVGVF
jgi:hypothetical protein